MNSKQKKKCYSVLAVLGVIGIATSLVLYALKQNIDLFFTPSQLFARHIHANQSVRLGGYVAQHTVHYDSDGKGVTFTVTDMKNTIIVHFNGILPSLFREGQGVVVTGKLTDANTFQATQVLAKHDEKYVPWTLRNNLK